MKQAHQDQSARNYQPRLAPWCRLLCGCLLLFLVAMWAGCKPAPKAAAEINPVGTYALASIDGKSVPCTVQHGGHGMAVQSGSFVINADGTCSSKITLSGRDQAIEVKATYTRQGSTLAMQWQGAGTTTGTVEGNTFTMSNEGMVFAYRK